MKNQKFLIIGLPVLIALLCVTDQAFARTNKLNKSQRLFKEDVAKRHQKNLITQEQREAAAKRLKDSSPEAAAKIAEIRATLSRAAADRVAGLGSATTLNEQKQYEEISKIAQRQAAIREKDSIKPSIKIRRSR